ncbi:MAG: hypothetical protein Q4G49_18020 [Paracoccus sp. (in: a-proteobacteria)]|nr:hypothetical protein [Paracoccus sp. (in: a-proteobacteria)]
MRLALILALLAGPAMADAPLFIVDRTQMAFDLGPGHPANSPARASNSPNAAWNSAANSANSAAAYENRPDNPANQNRLIFTADGHVLGYYAVNAGGVLNLFDLRGRRVAYRPARGTRSLFTTAGEWCGTVDTNRGGFALGVTRQCVARFGQ